MNTPEMSDQLLRKYVDGIFQRYDTDRTMTLTADELALFFNDLLADQGSNQQMTPQQVQQSMRAIDANNDGRITKMELFMALKKMNGQSNFFGQSIQQTNTHNNNIYPTFNTEVRHGGNQNNGYNTGRDYGYDNRFYHVPESFQNNPNAFEQNYPKNNNNIQPRSYEGVIYQKPKQQLKKQYSSQGYSNPTYYYQEPQYVVQGSPMLSSPFGMGMGMGRRCHRSGRGMGMGFFGSPFSGLMGGLFGLGGLF